MHGHVDLIDADGRAAAPRRPSATTRSSARRTATAGHVRRLGVRLPLLQLGAHRARRRDPQAVGLYDPALLLDDYDLYLRLALDWRIVFLEGPAVALYRHHPGQMTTYELTMGQIQTAEKHLALLDGRDGRARRASSRAATSSSCSRAARAVLGDQARRAGTCCARSGSTRRSLREPWVARRLVASLVKR